MADEKCPCGHAKPWPVDQPFPDEPGVLIPYCLMCWRAGNRPTAVAAKKPEPPKPCRYFEDADKVPAAELVQLGLNPLADFRLCEHPKKPLGEKVCSCRGCGPGCKGYLASA